MSETDKIINQLRRGFVLMKDTPEEGCDVCGRTEHDGLGVHDGLLLCAVCERQKEGEA